MTALFVGLLAAIDLALLDFFSANSDHFTQMAFHAETVIGTGFSPQIVENLYNIVLGFGISLIVLQFLKKGFEAYTLWTDGDPDMDPLILLTNFFKALAVALSFGVAYDWIVNVAEDLLAQVLDQIRADVLDYDALAAHIAETGLFDVLVYLIFLVFWMILYLQFLMRGLEIMILRIGVPFACLGLLDSDQGVFKPYIQRFFQNALTIVIQIALLRLGVNLLAAAHPVWGISAMMMALSTPKFLREFMTAAGGSRPMGGTVYQTMRAGQMVRGLAGKGR